MDRLTPMAIQNGALRRNLFARSGHLLSDRAVSRWIWLATLVSSLNFTLLPHALAQTQPAPSIEYQVKAAYLLNFLSYVEWPSSAYSRTGNSIRVCVLGEDPFREILDRTVENDRIDGRRIEALRLPRGANVHDCHIVFISRSERDRMTQILASLRGSTVLTVSDISGFSDMGGMIEFTILEAKVRFFINTDASDAAGLKLSSRLLRTAQAVKGSSRE